MYKGSFWWLGVALTLGIGYLTLRPSFNLALTGDDYLGLWRYDFYINGWGGERLTNLQFFFTDYGPQDVVTAIIHHYFNFNHRVYYFFSFLLRVAASFSFLWPVYKLTKSKWASLGTAAFFLITTTGLEATDWSFNMPSYLAIAIMNTLLGFFIISRTKNGIGVWILSALLFTLAIMAQPIRMMFLPVLLVGLEIYWLMFNLGWRGLFLTVLRVVMYVMLTWAILHYTSYGNSVSARGSKAIRENYGTVVTYIQRLDLRILLSPIRQMGVMLIPNEFMYQRLEVWGLPRTFRRVVIPTFIVYAIFISLVSKSRQSTALGLVIGGWWTYYIWKNFMIRASYPLQPFELLTFLIGGYFLVGVTLWWRELSSEKNLRLGLAMGVFTMILGFIIAWLRNPGTVHEITGRYLIVPAAGLAWLTSVMLANKRIWMICLFGLLFSLHAQSSYKYLRHLSEVRGIELTDRLRGSVKPAKNFGKDVPLVFYFEGDDPEILQHAFIFGFPVISHYQFGIIGPWYNIATTNIWAEVESAYLDGQSLKRFMPGPYGPVALENIFAYRLERGNLLNVTEEKRELLEKIRHAENK